MQTIYKPWCKAAMAVLCILLLTAGMLALVPPVAVSAFGSGSVETFADLLTERQLRRDVEVVMFGYFDADSADHTGGEYYNLSDEYGIYAGEDSNFRYTVTEKASGKTVLETLNGSETSRHLTIAGYFGESDEEYVFTGYVLKDLAAHDSYWEIQHYFGVLDLNNDCLLWFALTALLLGAVLLALLCSTAARRSCGGECFLSPMHRVPGDLALAAFLWLCLTGLVLLLSFDDGSGSAMFITVIVLLFLLCGSLGVYVVVSFAARLKNHVLLRTTLCGWLFCRLKKLVLWVLQSLPMIWRTAVGWCLLCVLELLILLLRSTYSELVVLFILEKLLLTPVVVYLARMLRRLKQGAETIAAGDYTTPVNTKGLVLDLKETADTLNHIRAGMSAEVESRMRSERMKTELITNVSHDIKTPLTGIVSYVDLLKQEPAGSAQAAEYLAVLDRQSQRLKRLTEDLVEASRAATGNVELQLEEVDASMLAEQAAAEYASRLEAAGLTTVLERPMENEEPQPVLIRADGRQLWRVFDNLLSNAVKYAMPGTRVYLTVRQGQQVTVTLRNISREPLNISAEELMERFVRGDVSRHTEGSGLGLSIARSLTEAMGGKLSLTVDGDLFKAELAFPHMPAPEASGQD